MIILNVARLTPGVFIGCVVFAGFLSGKALADTSNPVKVDINLDMKHSVSGVSDFGRERHITHHANVNEGDWANIDIEKYYLMNELDVQFGRDNGNASFFMGWTRQDPNNPGAPDTSHIQELNDWWSSAYADLGLSVHSYEPRAGALIMGLNPEKAYPTQAYWHTEDFGSGPMPYLHGQSNDGGRYLMQDWEGAADWVAAYLDEFFRSDNNPNAHLRPQYWEVVNEPDMTLNQINHSTYYASWESIFQYHNDVAEKVRERLKEDAPKIGGMTWGLHDLHQGDYGAQAAKANGLEGRRSVLGFWYRDPDSSAALEHYKFLCEQQSVAYPCSAAAEAQAGDRAAWDKVWAATESDYWNHDNTEAFFQWDYLWKGFMDAAGENMDFYSIHLYDWVAHGNPQTPVLTEFDDDTEFTWGRWRSGGHTEAVFEMVDWYQQHKFGERKPWVISEYGSIVSRQDPAMDYRWADWTHIRTYNWMFMQMLNRPDQIEVSMPFHPTKASWGYAWDANGPILRYEPSLLQNDELKLANEAGGWYFTDKIHWYELWSEVKGTRLDTFSTDADIQAHAYVDGNTLFVLLNNMEWHDSTVDLSFINQNGNNVNKVSLKHNYLGKGLSDYAPGRSVLANAEITNGLPESLVVPPGSTMVLKVEFEQDLTLNQSSNEIKYFAESLSGAGTEDGAVHRIAASGSWESAQVNDVVVPAQGEAILRITGQFANQAYGDSRVGTGVRVNGNEITIPTSITETVNGPVKHYDFLGLDYTSNGNNLLRTIDIPVPVTYLQSNNTIEWNFISGVVYVSASLSVMDMSRAVVRSSVDNRAPVAATGLSITNTDITVGVKRSAYLEPSFSPTNASNQRINWSSDNVKVAHVDPNGIVTGMSIGNATITGVSEDGGFQVTKQATVVAIAVESVELMYEQSPSLFVGGTYTLNAYVKPFDASNKAVTFVSLNPDVATVDEHGVVTGVNDGTAMITMKTADGGFSVPVSITVENLPLVDIRVAPKKTLLPVNDQLPLNVTFTPANASDRTLAWSSSDDSIASVDSDGVVTGKLVGQAIITAMSNDGGFKDMVEVNVVAASGAPIVIEAESFKDTGGATAGFLTEELASASGGTVISNNQTGDWADYEINFSKAGAYQLKINASSPGTGIGIRVTVDSGSSVSNSMPTTGGWGDFVDHIVTNNLIIPTPGLHIIRIESIGAAGAWQWNTDTLSFAHLADCGIAECGDSSSSSMPISSRSSSSRSSSSRSSSPASSSISSVSSSTLSSAVFSSSESSASSRSSLPIASSSSPVISSSSSSSSSQTATQVTASEIVMESVVADGGDSGVTVLRFKLNSDSEGATMRDLSIAASGELNDKDAISQVSLYLDGNQSGNAANATHLVSGSYSADNGEIVFDLSSSPVNLQAGDTYFFITYDFN